MTTLLMSRKLIDRRDENTRNLPGIVEGTKEMVQYRLLPSCHLISCFLPKSLMLRPRSLRSSSHPAMPLVGWNMCRSTVLTTQRRTAAIQLEAARSCKPRWSHRQRLHWALNHPPEFSRPDCLERDSDEKSPSTKRIRMSARLLLPVNL